MKIVKTKSVTSKTNKTNVSKSHPHSGIMFLKGLKTSFEIMKEEKKGFKKGVVKLKNKVNPNTFDDFVNKLLKNNKNKPFNFVSMPSKL